MSTRNDLDRDNDDQREKDFEVYRILLDLWSKENPIKTTKLQVLLVVNGLLVSAINVAGKGFSQDEWFLYLAGAVFNLIWTFSIGRTSLFQEAWQLRLGELHDRYPNDPRFSILETAPYRQKAAGILRAFGFMSSRWYLLFSPFIFAITWLVILVLNHP
ncbi:MAG TPA: hypothetical protein VGJ57_03205 [Nitrospirales bacterium]|jgi:hypothetical protein